MRNQMHIALLYVALITFSLAETTTPEIDCSSDGAAAFRQPGAPNKTGYFQVIHTDPHGTSTTWPPSPLSTTDFVNDALFNVNLIAVHYNVSTTSLWNVWLFTLTSSSAGVSDPVAAAYCAATVLNSSSRFRSDYLVVGAFWGNVPVNVPDYLRRPTEENDLVFTVMGSIAAIFTLVQGAYGFYYMRVTSGTLKKKDPEAGMDNDDS